MIGWVKTPITLPGMKASTICESLRPSAENIPATRANCMPHVYPMPNLGLACVCHVRRRDFHSRIYVCVFCIEFVG